IAGPNGSGKSTIARLVGFEGRDRLLDADAIAHGMNPANPRMAAMDAGREILRRIEDCLGSGVSFAVETTFSSRKHAELIRRAKAIGYEIHLGFVALESRERCISRVR